MNLKWIALAIVLCAGTAIVVWPLATGRSVQAAPPPPSSSCLGPVLSDTGMEELRATDVLVEDLDPEWARAVGLSEREIEAEVELYLRRVPGLKLVKSTSFADPVLRVVITGIIAESGTSAAAVRLELTQSGALGRIASGDRTIIAVGAATWDAADLLTGPADPAQGHRVKKTLTALLDQFQSDYLKANPQIKP